MENNDSIEQLHILKLKQKECSEIKFLQYIKNRLKSIAKKKFTTCFIFAISEFEKVWGQELWGHGLPDNKLTDSQRANKIRWEQVRRDILDKGNNQLRGFESEIDIHNISFKGYKITFVGNKGDKNGTN
jgi:hypothetical protein